MALKIYIWPLGNLSGTYKPIAHSRGLSSSPQLMTLPFILTKGLGLFFLFKAEDVQLHGVNKEWE